MLAGATGQKAPAASLLYLLTIVFKSFWKQGVLPGYRRAYWQFLGRLMMRWGLAPQKRRLGFELALSGHHFIRYARQVAETLNVGTPAAFELNEVNGSTAEIAVDDLPAVRQRLPYSRASS